MRLPWTRYIGHADVSLFSGALRITIYKDNQLNQSSVRWVASASLGPDDKKLFIVLDAQSVDEAIGAVECWVKKNCSEILNKMNTQGEKSEGA